MTYIIGVIASLIGGLFFYRTKAKSAEALNENVETKSNVNAIQAEINQDGAGIKSEHAKIASEQEKIRDVKGEVVNNEKLSDFFSNYRKP